MLSRNVKRNLNGKIIIVKSPSCQYLTLLVPRPHVHTRASGSWSSGTVHGRSRGPAGTRRSSGRAPIGGAAESPHLGSDAIVVFILAEALNISPNLIPPLNSWRTSARSVSPLSIRLVCLIFLLHFKIYKQLLACFFVFLHWKLVSSTHFSARAVSVDALIGIDWAQTIICYV